MTLTSLAEPPPIRDLREENRRFYDMLWSGAQLIEPERFNTWPLVASLLAQGDRRLEVAPGLRPRLPIEGTQFVDISAPALGKLQERGAQVSMGEVTALPFKDASFDLVCAFDIVEHVDDEDLVLSELARVLAPGGALLLSLPLHPALWTTFDDLVGHKRRYEPERLPAKLGEHHFTVERSAVYGMKPKSTWLVDLGMWWMLHHRDRAMWWYNRAIMPIGMRSQRELKFETGLIAPEGVDEILMVCRR